MKPLYLTPRIALATLINHTDDQQLPQMLKGLYRLFSLACSRWAKYVGVLRTKLSNSWKG